MKNIIITTLLLLCLLFSSGCTERNKSGTPMHETTEYDLDYSQNLTITCYRIDELKTFDFNFSIVSYGYYFTERKYLKKKNIIADVRSPEIGLKYNKKDFNKLNLLIKNNECETIFSDFLDLEFTGDNGRTIEDEHICRLNIPYEPVNHFVLEVEIFKQCFPPYKI